MNEKTETDKRQQPVKKSLPPSIIFGPIFGSLIGLVGGLPWLGVTMPFGR